MKQEAGVIAFEMRGIPAQSAVYVAYKRIMDIAQGLGYQALPVQDADGLLHEASGRVGRAVLICANIWQLLRAVANWRLRKVRKIFWVQGLVGEESYLRHHSRPRRMLLNALEYLALRLSDGFIYVSPYMKQYFEARYGFLSLRPSVVLPCISTIGLRDAAAEKEAMSFCYLGGMSAWQRIKETIECMNDVVAVMPEAKFYLATKDTAEANRQMQTHATEALQARTVLSSLSGDAEVEKFLGRMQFGFLLRGDSIVNYVASPIKLAEYLGFGVHVIMTDNIKSYAPLVTDAGAGIVLSQAEMLERRLAVRLKALPGNAKGMVEASLRLHETGFSMQAGRTVMSGFFREMLK